MHYEFFGDIEFFEIDNSVHVRRIGFSPSGDSAVAEIERHECPEKFEPFSARVELGTTTPGGNWLSKELRIFPEDPAWGVRIEIKRRKTKFCKDADGTPCVFVVGTWIDYDHNHKSEKNKKHEWKFMGLLKGRNASAPLVTDVLEVEINSKLRTRA